MCRTSNSAIMRPGLCELMLLMSAIRSFAHKPHCEGVGSALCDETSGYIVILDAGSSHTAISAFRYDRRTLIPGKFPLIIDSPVTVPELLARFKERPGLTAFANRTNDLASSLHKVCMAAKDALLLHNPSVELKHIPIYLAATAGLRQTVLEDRDRIMQSVRAYLKSKDNPFSFRRDEQARVIAGEEEGAFGWLALNQLEAAISPNPYTFGALDFGGGSVQITFVSSETSILAGIFPLHFGGASAGPIHLYSHSYPKFGNDDAWQRATQHLLGAVGRNSSQGGTEVEHPCLPPGLTWHVDPGEFGMSIFSEHRHRSNGTVALKGTGDFHRCQAVAEHLINAEAPCYQPPCSLLGVYQPELNNTRFVLFGEYKRFLQWGVTALARDGHTVLSALRTQLPRLCSLPHNTQLELFGHGSLNGVPPCWRGTWILTFLSKGLHFNEHSADLRVIAGCCDHTLGQAIYEINFFPYRLEDVKPSKQLPSLVNTSQMSTSLSGGMPDAFSAWEVAISWAAGAFIGAAITTAIMHCTSFMAAGVGKTFPLVIQEGLLRS